MKVRITFYGMVLIELSTKDRAARILAVNATTMHRPYHHPILCANKGTLAMDPSLPVIPSLNGLLDRTAGALRPNAEGWHLSGMTVTLGKGAVPKHARGFSAKEARHPKAVDGSWSAMKWIPDLGLIQPGAKLKESYRTIGANVLSIIELRGGELKAQKPSSPQTGGLMFWFSPNCQQACTDLFTWEGNVDDGIRLTDQSGTTRSAKLRASKETVDLFVSHEAPQLENQLELEHDIRQRGEEARAAEPRLNHFSAFYAALDKCPYSVGAPRGVWRFDPNAESRFQSDISCVPALI